MRMQMQASIYFFNNIKELQLNTEGSAAAVWKEMINKKFTP